MSLSDSANRVTYSRTKVSTTFYSKYWLPIYSIQTYSTFQDFFVKGFLVSRSLTRFFLESFDLTFYFIAELTLSSICETFTKTANPMLPFFLLQLWCQCSDGGSISKVCMWGGGRQNL